jgi:hypothetical protein
VRLSTFPLISNPWDNTLQLFLRQNLWKNLLYHSNPLNTAAQNIEPRKKQRDEIFVGRRLRRPTMYTTAQHIVLSLVASFLIAYIAVVPLSINNGNSNPLRLFVRSVHTASCILTMLGSLVSILDGASHEINPYLLLDPSSSKTNWYKNISSNVSTRVACTTLIVPIMSILLTLFVVRDLDYVSYTNIAPLYILLLRNCTLMALYVHIMDEMMRTSLFHPRPDLSKMVNELSDEMPNVALLGVILNSILCDPALVQQVVHSSHQLGIGGPERDELKLSKKLTKQMASVYLTSSATQSEAPLEEDVLRVIILETMGGGTRCHSSTTKSMSERHRKIISEWIDRPVPRRQSTKLQEPLSSLLLRGLCIFIGGAGEALTICAQSSENARMWKIPPAMFCCLELCIEATKRFVVCSLTPSGRTLCDWKSSHLSIHVPSVLVALYQLRQGIVQYSKLVHSESNCLEYTVTEIGAHLTKEYGQIVQDCDLAAISILRSMKSLKGLGRIDLALDPDCLEWKNLLIARNTE